MKTRFTVVCQAKQCHQFHVIKLDTSFPFQLLTEKLLREYEDRVLAGSPSAESIHVVNFERIY